VVVGVLIPAVLVAAVDLMVTPCTGVEPAAPRQLVVVVVVVGQMATATLAQVVEREEPADLEHLQVGTAVVLGMVLPLAVVVVLQLVSLTQADKLVLSAESSFCII